MLDSPLTRVVQIRPMCANCSSSNSRAAPASIALTDVSTSGGSGDQRPPLRSTDITRHARAARLLPSGSGWFQATTTIGWVGSQPRPPPAAREVGDPPRERGAKEFPPLRGAAPIQPVQAVEAHGDLVVTRKAHHAVLRARLATAVAASAGLICAGGSLRCSHLASLAPGVHRTPGAGAAVLPELHRLRAGRSAVYPIPTPDGSRPVRPSSPSGSAPEPARPPLTL